MMEWTRDNVVTNLAAHHNASRRKTLMKQGSDSDAVGVPLGILRKLAREIGRNHALALELWATQIVDYQLLAVMLFDPQKMDVNMTMSMLDGIVVMTLQEDLIFKCLVLMPEKDKLMQCLASKAEDHFGRALWTFYVDQIKHKHGTNDELQAILEVIDANLSSAQPLTQWMMNRALCEIGFGYEDFTKQAYAIGTKHGVYKEMTVAKGCTSAYAPLWMDAVLKRNV